MPREIVPVQTTTASEAPDPNPPMHPRERSAIVEAAVLVALDPEASEQDRADARQTIEALQEQEGGGG